MADSPGSPPETSSPRSGRGRSPDASTGASEPAAEDGGAPSDAPKPAVENRWWVDSSTAKRARSGEPAAAPAPGRIVGERLFRVGRDYDQDRARSHLSDSNLGWLREGNPPEDGWAYLSLTDNRSRDDFLTRVKQAIRLPRGARGVLVDSGSSLRVITTGSPVGERICELSLAGDSSFDAWVKGEWVCERVFRGRDRALREAPGLVARYLADDS